MVIDYILFEKKAENDKHIIWTADEIKSFCKDQEIEYEDIKEETLFYVVIIKQESNDINTNQHYRLLQVTETVSFILKDDPSLDEITELEYSTESLPDLKAYINS